VLLLKNAHMRYAAAIRLATHNACDKWHHRLSAKGLPESGVLRWKGVIAFPSDCCRQGEIVVIGEDAGEVCDTYVILRSWARR